LPDKPLLQVVIGYSRDTHLCPVLRNSCLFIHPVELVRFQMNCMVTKIGSFSITLRFMYLNSGGASYNLLYYCMLNTYCGWWTIVLVEVTSLCWIIRKFKKSLKIPKGQSESVYRRRTANTMAKRKSTKGQTTIYKTYKTKNQVTRTPLKTGGELRWSRRVSSSTSGTRRVILVTNPVIHGSREWGKDREVFTTSETYPWSSLIVWYTQYYFYVKITK